MGDLYQDLCYGARVLRRTPGFTAVAVFTLALGIAANTTVFSWIDTVLVHPIPGTTDDHRLVVLQILTTGWNNGTVNFSHDDYRTARDNLKLLSGIALYTSTTLNMAKGTGVERVFGELVSGNYFAVLGVRPLVGRVFLPQEYVVAGVANDCKYHSLSEPPQPFIYLRHAYTNDESISFCIRSASGSRDWPATLRREISATEPNVAVFDAMLLTEHMGGALFAQKVAASLLSVLGGLSLVLAAVGLYSVMAYSVSQRRQEIGIRMALGAERREVLGMVVRQGMFLTGVGLVVGIGAALAAARLVTGMLVNLSASDPAIYCGVALFLSVVALLASWIPARRATRIDPIEALRHQ